MKTILKLASLLVIAHLLLGGVLLAIEAAHGINDQDASFAVALLFYYLNFPSVWLLRWMGATPGIIAVILVGIVQWTALAVLIGGRMPLRSLRQCGGLDRCEGASHSKNGGD